MTATTDPLEYKHKDLRRAVGAEIRRIWGPEGLESGETPIDPADLGSPMAPPEFGDCMDAAGQGIAVVLLNMARQSPVWTAAELMDVARDFAEHRIDGLPD